MKSKVDQYFRKLMLSTIYKGGWGKPKDLAKIIEYRRHIVGKRETCQFLVPKDYPINIDKEHKFENHTVLEGSFLTPFVHHIPDLIPEAIRQAKFQLLLPNKWKTDNKPVVFHFAGTGDQNYWRRRVLLARPLLTENNLASLIIENPFYGQRKPKEQERTNLIYVKDIFIMGACLITEGLALMNYFERIGLGPFVLTGFSMGGYMASLTATVSTKPVALVPCLSWTTAGPVFTRGVMSEAIAWNVLKEQYYSCKEYSYLKDLKTFNNMSVKERGLIEIFEFMHLLMDECTHMLNYDKPIDTSMIRVISAKDDAYVLRDGVNDFNSIWPGSQVEFVDEGHVTAFVLLQQKFRETIVTMLQKLIDKHYS